MPLMFWMYIFTNLFPYSVSRLQFIGGIFVGIISSIPLVFHGQTFLWRILENIFFALSQWWFFWILQNFALLFLCIFWLYFSVSYVFQNARVRFLRTFFFSILTLILALIFGIWIMLFLQYLFPGVSSGAWVWFWNTISFISVGWIFAYYMVVSLLEEGNKYIAGLSFSGKSDYFLMMQKYLSLTACIALGFAFFENILYAYFYVQSSWIQGSLISLVFFRSIFTVILHLMSSLLFALGFWYIIWNMAHKIWKQNIWKRAIYSFIFVSLWVVSHVIFDSVLSFGYMAFLIFYIFFMYVLISYIMIQTVQWPENTEFL